MAALNFARSFPFPPHRQHMGQGGATIIDSICGRQSFSFGVRSMREAYLDESSSTASGEPVLIVAGFVSDKERWALFEEKWRETVLAPYKITHLHTKQLRSHNDKLYRHLNLDARKSLRSNAVETIAAHVESAFSIYMRPHDWQHATTAEERRRWGSCYGICTELLLVAMSENKYGGPAPERMNVFLEDGHANLGDALKRIRYYQQDTEPPEWPQLVDDANFNNVETQRLSAMRIGEVGTVSKLSSCAAQAGDMLAYLVGYVFSRHRTRAFEGVFDHLLSLQPVCSTGYGPSSVTELTEALREVERMPRETEKAYMQRRWSFVSAG